MANKPIILHIAFILLLLNSCTSETEIPVSPNTLTLEIKAENFFPTDNSTTRTTDKGYETFFTDGDKIGITIVKGGKIVDKISLSPTTSAPNNGLPTALIPSMPMTTLPI